ncbi:MAG: DUF1007 family protein [Spirochaetota bacterium]
MRTRLWMVACLCLLSPTVLRAHPHLWIDGTFDFHLDETGVRAITVSWLFDEFNSADMIQFYDADRDGALSTAETRTIRTEGFAHLIEYGYYVVAHIDECPVEIPEADTFRAEVVNGRLRYEFTVPLSVPWDDLDRFAVGLFDESYYVDFLSDPLHSEYSRSGRRFVVTRQTRELASVGWGTILVPILALEAR